MKKLLLIAVLLTFATGTAIAQQKGGPGSPSGGQGNSGYLGNGQVERLTEQLGLDEAQAAEIAIIFEEAQLLRDEERARMRAIAAENRANTHAMIIEVLTPEQQALFDELQQKREELRQALGDMGMSRRGGGFGGGAGGGFRGGPGTGDCSG